MLKTVAFILIFVTPFSIAEESEIDLHLSECIDKHPTTVGMTNCIYEAEAAWDEELNQVYKELISRLNASAQSSLREAQRSWIRYRDNERDAAIHIYKSLQGSMYIPMAGNRIMELTKQRTLELNSYYELLKYESDANK